MHLFRQIITTLFCASLLVACGGGGGGGGDSSNSPNSGGNPAGDWLTFNPSQVDISVYEGSSVPISVVGTATKKFSKSFNIAIVDSVGVITPSVSISAISPMQYQVTLNSNLALKTGVYTSNVQVRLCEDDPKICNVPFPGSPWTLPIKITVKSNADVGVNVTSTPAPLELTTYPGEAVQFVVSAESQIDTGKAFKIGIIDSGLNSKVKSTGQVSNTKSIATLETNPDLKPGEYSSMLEIRTCADDPVVCKLPSSGSPRRIPLKIKVRNTTNLIPLRPVPQLGAWSTFQGNAAHNGHVPASFSPSNFLRRWSWSSSEISSSSYVSIDNGLLYLTKATASPGEYELIALNEANGQVQWRTRMGRLYGVNAPAAGNGRVFVTARGDWSMNATNFLWVFNQDGILLNQVPIPWVSTERVAPTIFDNEVFDGYSNNLMSKYLTGHQKLAWSVNLPIHSTLTPAVDANYAYSFMGGNLFAVKKTDGSLAYTINANPQGFSTDLNGFIPVLSNKNMAFVDWNGLQAFDLNTRQRVWTSSGGYPAYANNVVYVINNYGKVLEARSAQNGGLLWSVNVLTQEEYASGISFNTIIVSDNLVFISSGSGYFAPPGVRTLAIDINTHKVVWEHPLGGSLAISSYGVLYIKGKTRIDAINLQ